MKIVYISRSIIPSRTANSINVMKMCNAFASLGHEVVLLAPWTKKLEEKDINEDGSYTLKKYKYDGFLNIVEIKEENSENVFLNHTQKFKYINNLLVEESMIDNIDNKVFSLKKYLFVFDKNKNWIKKTIIENDIPKEIIERVIEYY